MILVTCFNSFSNMILHVTHTHAHTYSKKGESETERVTFFFSLFWGCVGGGGGEGVVLSVCLCACVCVRARVSGVCLRVCVLLFDFHRAGHDEIFRTIKLKSADRTFGMFYDIFFFSFLLILTDITRGLNVCSHEYFSLSFFFPKCKRPNCFLNNAWGSLIR